MRKDLCYFFGENFGKGNNTLVISDKDDLHTLKLRV